MIGTILAKVANDKRKLKQGVVKQGVEGGKRGERNGMLSV